MCSIYLTYQVTDLPKDILRLISLLTLCNETSYERVDQLCTNHQLKAVPLNQLFGLLTINKCFNAILTEVYTYILRQNMTYSVWNTCPKEQGKIQIKDILFPQVSAGTSKILHSELSLYWGDFEVANIVTVIYPSNPLIIRKQPSYKLLMMTNIGNCSWKCINDKFIRARSIRYDNNYIDSSLCKVFERLLFQVFPDAEQHFDILRFKRVKLSKRSYSRTCPLYCPTCHGY